LTRGCFSSGRYDNSEIGTLKCFFPVLVDRIEQWCKDIFCSTR